MLDLYVPETHHSIASIAAYDMRAVALAYLSWDLFILGFPDQALSRSQQSLAWCRDLCHPHSLGFALGSAAVFGLLRAADRDALVALDHGIVLATEQKFPYWPAMSKVMRARVLVSKECASEALALARTGFAELTATGAVVNQTYFLGLLAQTCYEAGKTSEALDLLATALEGAELTGERWIEAELHRLKGEWCNGNFDTVNEEPEVNFRRALAVAKAQDAKIWELRAAMSLARLWRNQGKPQQARDLLAPVYDWFTEGFDTRDLKEAKMLLDDLHA